MNTTPATAVTISPYMDRLWGGTYYDGAAASFIPVAELRVRLTVNCIYLLEDSARTVLWNNCTVVGYS